MNRPDIELNEEISVEGVRCIVSRVREQGHSFGDCEVVCNPEKPANRDVVWQNNNWQFKESGDYGGYAAKNPSLRFAVAKLRS